jgi:hypothetical protein
VVAVALALDLLLVIGCLIVPLALELVDVDLLDDFCGTKVAFEGAGFFAARWVEGAILDDGEAMKEVVGNLEVNPSHPTPQFG